MRRITLAIRVGELNLDARPSSFTISKENLAIHIKGENSPKNYEDFNAWLLKNFQLQGVLSQDKLCFFEPKSAFIVAIQLLKYNFIRKQNNLHFITLAKFAIERYPLIKNADCSQHLEDFFQIVSQQYSIQISEYFCLAKMAKDLDIHLDDIALGQTREVFFDATKAMILDIENLMRRSGALHPKIIAATQAWATAYNDLASNAISAARSVIMAYQKNPLLFSKEMNTCFATEPAFELLRTAKEMAGFSVINAKKEFKNEAPDSDKEPEITTFNNLTSLDKKFSDLVNNKVQVEAFIKKFDLFVEYLRENKNELGLIFEALNENQIPVSNSELAKHPLPLAKTALSLFCFGEPWKNMPLAVCSRILHYLTNTTEQRSQLTAWISAGRRMISASEKALGTSQQGNEFALFEANQGPKPGSPQEGASMPSPAIPN